MVDSITIKKNFSGHFLLDEHLIRQLQKHLAEFTNKSPSATLVFQGERTIRSEDFNALFADSYISSSRITSMQLEAGAFFDEQKCLITFNDKYDPPIQVEITGHRQSSISLETSIVNEINGSRSWLWPVPYSRISDFFFALSIVVPAIMIVVAVREGLENVPPWSMATFLLVSIFNIITFKWGPIVLPSIDFNFGHGGKSYQRRMQGFRLVFSGVIFAIFIGVAGNFFSKKIGL